MNPEKRRSVRPKSWRSHLRNSWESLRGMATTFVFGPEEEEQEQQGEDETGNDDASMFARLDRPEEEERPLGDTLELQIEADDPHGRAMMVTGDLGNAHEAALNIRKVVQDGGLGEYQSEWDEEPNWSPTGTVAVNSVNMVLPCVPGRWRVARLYPQADIHMHQEDPENRRMQPCGTIFWNVEACGGEDLQVARDLMLDLCNVGGDFGVNTESEEAQEAGYRFIGRYSWQYYNNGKSYCPANESLPDGHEDKMVYDEIGEINGGPVVCFLPWRDYFESVWPEMKKDMAEIAKQRQVEQERVEKERAEAEAARTDPNQFIYVQNWYKHRTRVTILPVENKDTGTPPHRGSISVFGSQEYCFARLRFQEMGTKPACNFMVCYTYHMPESFMETCVEGLNIIDLPKEAVFRYRQRDEKFAFGNYLDSLAPSDMESFLLSLYPDALFGYIISELVTSNKIMSSETQREVIRKMGEMKIFAKKFSATRKDQMKRFYNLLSAPYYDHANQFAMLQALESNGLLEPIISTDFEDYTGKVQANSLLHYADDIATIDFLISHGMDPNRHIEIETLRFVRDSCLSKTRSPLGHKVANDDAEIVEHLVNVVGVDVTAEEIMVGIAMMAEKSIAIALPKLENPDEFKQRRDFSLDHHTVRENGLFGAKPPTDDEDEEQPLTGSCIQVLISVFIRKWFIKVAIAYNKEQSAFIIASASPSILSEEEKKAQEEQKEKDRKERRNKGLQAALATYDSFKQSFSAILSLLHDTFPEFDLEQELNGMDLSKIHPSSKDLNEDAIERLREAGLPENVLQAITKPHDVLRSILLKRYPIMIDLEKKGNVWVMTFKSKPKGEHFDNTFNPDFIKAIHEALDKVEEDRGNECALVTTSVGKIYSNGLDIEWLMTQEIGGEVQLGFLADFHKLLLRMLTFPMPTVAAINGHAFAGGLLFALAHDYRVMNGEKGFVCMTEVDMGATLTPPLNAMIKEKIPRRLAAKLMLEACRLNASDLLEEKVIEAKAVPNELLATGLALAEKFAPKGMSPAYGQIKEDLYIDAVKMLKDGPVIRASL